MKSLAIHRLAEAELDQAIRYYERQQPGLGLNLHTEVRQTLSLIQANPELGSPYKGKTFRHRLLRGFPYVIYYKVYEHIVWISAIAHTSRRPDYWQRRRLE